MTPAVIDDMRAAFPTYVGDLMPAMDDIPEDFWRDRGEARPWLAFQRRWFFKGITRSEFRAKDGIDEAAALRHLTTIQRSWEPKHEHKEAAVAYLASLWLELTGAAS